jgi:hypothetical protein
MRPIILKLLQQEPVTHHEWQELFYSVHLVCLWDEKGPPKVKEALKDDIMDFIKKAQQVINMILAVGLGFFGSMICTYCKLETKCRLAFLKWQFLGKINYTDSTCMSLCGCCHKLIKKIYLYLNWSQRTEFISDRMFLNMSAPI